MIVLDVDQTDVALSDPADVAPLHDFHEVRRPPLDQPPQGLDERPLARLDAPHVGVDVLLLRHHVFGHHAVLTYSSTLPARTSSGTLPPSTTVSSKPFRSNFGPSDALAFSRWRLISL